MKTTLITLTILLIISQTIHTWLIFYSFSRLEGWLKTTQAVLFCAVISVSILVFVLIGRQELALIGAIIEVIINIYYYGMDFFENGIRARVRRVTAVATFWRKNWIGFFFGIVLPMAIYVFAEIIGQM